MQNTDIAVSFVDSSTIQLRLDLGTIIRARQTTELPTGGTMGPDGYYTRNGEIIGRIGGQNGEYFMPFERVQPSSIADLFDVRDVAGVLRAPADNLGRWIVTVNGVEVDLNLVSRKSHILDTARTGPFEFDFATTENVFLHLDVPLRPGDDIQIRFDDTDFTPVAAEYTPSTVVSEAIHVNLTGFDPNDAHKVAYLSSWNGFAVDGALPGDGRGVPTEFRPGTDWRVVNSDTGQTVMRGEIEMFMPQESLQDFTENYQGTDVWAIDFSSLDDAGTYHVVVQGVGRSQDFDVADTHWDELYELGMQGFYHQRSGIALEQPFTDWLRPRDFNPADGVTIYETTVAITDTNMGGGSSDLPDPWDLFGTNMTGRTLNAWGGWHDAGDWDRRTPHLETVRKMVELWELTTGYQQVSTLSIPENGDAIPDVLNEAMFGLDVFRRLQAADGGVRGGIESEEHPIYGDGSWGESLRVFAYDTDPLTTWEYAAAAAKMANALDRYDADLAATYRTSAARAMIWAENNVPTGAAYDVQHQNARNVAAAEMFRLTGNARWNDLYQETTVYTGTLEDVEWFEHQFEAAFVYARTTRAGVNQDIRELGIADLAREADFLTTTGNRGGFGYTLNPYAATGWGQSGQSMDEAADVFLRMHALTGNARWLNETMADAQYLLGANALNMSYLTGTDGRGPRNILNVDAETMGEGPPPGITIYGDFSIRAQGWDFYHNIMSGDVWPNFYQTPVAESFNAFDYFVPAMEYTVMQGMQDTMFVTGYLAAQGMRSAQRGTTAAEIIRGDAGDDIILGLLGNDSLFAGRGDDRLAGGSGSDRILAGDGDDSMFGGYGLDRMEGAAGDDVLIGGGQNDAMFGGDGNDVLVGGTENDSMDGGTGHDTLLGSAGNDTLLGQSGQDILWGEAGNDDLRGGVGRDTLAGGRGSDNLYGGTNADDFVYKPGDGRDRIHDFAAGDDVIRIEGPDNLTEAQVLWRYGVLSTDGRQYTLTLSATDVLVIDSATRMTRADIAAAVELF